MFGIASSPFIKTESYLFKGKILAVAERGQMLHYLIDDSTDFFPRHDSLDVSVDPIIKNIEKGDYIQLTMTNYSSPLVNFVEDMFGIRKNEIISLTESYRFEIIKERNNLNDLMPVKNS